MEKQSFEFILPTSESPIIKVMGIGGGGCNAVKHMFDKGIKGVDFVICNTDVQVLESNPIPVKIKLGETGLGAGSKPDVAKKAAEDSSDDISNILKNNTKMLFITAGMGGGTGTGAAPVVAKIAKDLNILTVAIVTTPFMFEGNVRYQQAMTGIDELRQNVDALLVIHNEKLFDLYPELKISNAFSIVDDILLTAAKGIAEIITVPGVVNVDFEDVKTVMKDSGIALMGTGYAEGENRAIKSLETAIHSPLLSEISITGAQNVLLYISYGSDELTIREFNEMTSYLKNETGGANVIWGNSFNPELNGVQVTIIATGFNANNSPINANQNYENKSYNSLNTGEEKIGYGRNYKDDQELEKFENEPAYIRKGKKINLNAPTSGNITVKINKNNTTIGENNYLYKHVD
ncbi:MAG TPA: cell division protein FtsZ [Bacteroidales bacterium]|jgi:cell division protein FtsZ|nr:cell division protein FtsZ [Bacteroidales bacterium]MBP8946258.1 cell division protein FtsZ [Bacteroidales bacterium]HCM29511.1 cell division protein FtsZ [Bacteroidales bacterium]HNW20417.1 cell division protein FtsZ [Bacteroidales bacterium]HOC40858.1 cell division protein FtsZ [Bacteroidales bacterium]